MKAQCPECKVIYKIDDSKVPEKGGYITCNKCKARFKIIKKPVKQEENSQEQQKEIIICPDCGHVNVTSESCTGCGHAFSTDEKKKLIITLEKDREDT